MSNCVSGPGLTTNFGSKTKDVASRISATPITLLADMRTPFVIGKFTRLQCWGWPSVRDYEVSHTNSLYCPIGPDCAANRQCDILRRGGWRVSTNLYPLFDDLLLLDLPTICGPRRRSTLAFANVPPSCQTSAEEMGHLLSTTLTFSGVG